MRETKFRYYNAAAKMMYPNRYYAVDMDGNFLVSMPLPKDNNYSKDYRLFVKTELHPGDALMQYTGLHDKNGVEIFEGDLVRMPHDLHIGGEIVAHKGEYVTALVEWVTGTFRLNKPGHKSKHYYGVINFGENTDAKELEVIGNTYSNPELLEAKL